MENHFKINPLYLFGSITLGAIGAVTINKLKESRHKQHTIDQKNVEIAQQQEIYQDKFPALPNCKINKLLWRDDKGSALYQELKNLEEITCEIEKVPNLAYDLGITELPLIQNPMLGCSKYRSVFGGEGFLPETAFVNHDCFILQFAQFGPSDLLSKTKRWLRAGPRKHLFFRSEDIRAGIVVVGGLCPGLNVVIRELTMTLKFNYKVDNIIGAHHGYDGIYNNDWIELNHSTVKQIHHQGGCFLGTARTVFEPERILEELKKKGINQLYVIGGVGTLKCMQILHSLIKQRKLPITIAVIPKSIENEIPIVEKSFGVESAVEEAQKALQSGYAETHSKQNTPAIVRLMGTNTGFLSMFASQAFRSVNVCIVPEFQFDIYGERGILKYVYDRLKAKGTCLIVVSEGAVHSIRDAQVQDKGKDASGNIKLGDIGAFLKQEILKYNLAQGIQSDVKYIDPLYMVRSVKANSHDSKMCTQLAQNAIHAAMAGFTCFAVGHLSNKTCLIPLSEMNSGSYSNRITSTNIQWQRLLANTGQPLFLNEQNQ